MSWFQSKVKAVDGNETVYEVITGKHDVGCGVAVADIIRSREHFHDIMTETYTLISGALKVVIEGNPILLNQPGQSVMIPPKQKHYAISQLDVPARVLVASFPAWTLEDHHVV